MSLEKALSTRLLDAHPDVAAAGLESVSDAAAVGALVDAPPAIIAQVLTRLAPHRAAGALSRLESPVADDVIAHLGFDDTAHLVRRMDAEPRERFLETLGPQLSGRIRTLLAFPEGTAGSLMDSSVLALPLDVTAGDAIDQIRRAPDNVRYNLYVVDRERRLVGVLNLRELMLAARDATLGSIARHDVLSIEGNADRGAVLRHEAWREAHSLPVVDKHGTYMGAIRYRTWRLLVDEVGRERTRGAATTAEALGELFSAGMAGVIGALTHVASNPVSGASDVGD